MMKAQGTRDKALVRVHLAQGDKEDSRYKKKKQDKDKRNQETTK
jgi:hypothetical protein